MGMIAAAAEAGGGYASISCLSSCCKHTHQKVSQGYMPFSLDARAGALHPHYMPTRPAAPAAAAVCCFERSTYSKIYANVDERPIQFRRDGLPISARQVPGKPLMAPKLPSPSDLTVSKRLCAKYNHTTSVCIGVPGRKDPRHFNSVYSLVHTAPHR